MTRPLSILRVADIADNRTGGMSRYIHFVSDELRAAGHRVDHLFQDELHPTGPGGRFARFTTPLQVAREVFRRAAAGIRYDVVEIHEPIAAGYAAARDWGSRLPPLVVSVYALEARSHRARLSYDRLKRRPFSIRSRIGPLSIVCQANYALRRADHVCVETRADAEYLIRRLGVARRQVTIQHGGILSGFFADSPGPRAGILFVGTWITRKGILDLIPALTTVLQMHPGERATIAGCGFPVERVLADFPNQVQARIQVIPSVKDDDTLVRLFQSHAVFAFPSTFEGLPLAILEAAAARLGIVTTGVCGMADTIVDGVNGIVVPVGDAQRLTDAINRLVSDPSLAARLGWAAHESVRHYTWRRSADQFLTAVTTAVDRSGGRKCRV